MLELQNGISEQAWRQDVGEVREVLVEGASRQGQGQLFGRTTWNRIVNFSGPLELVGQVVPVRVTKSYRNSQLGELVT
jgi:tRNA-2-methylthio-N6-dimethylallyladenosine synthase